jgi:hypothetical protein
VGAAVDELSGGQSGGRRRGIGHGIICGAGLGQGHVRHGLHAETMVGAAGEEAGGGELRGGEIVRHEEDDGEGLLHDPFAVDDQAEAGEGEEAGKEDDFVADAGRHEGKETGEGNQCFSFSVFR